MSYTKITCSFCKEKILVSDYFLRQNPPPKNKFNTPTENEFAALHYSQLARSLCTCRSRTKNPTNLETKTYSTRLDKIVNLSKKKIYSDTPILWSTMIKNNVFVKDADKILSNKTFTKQNGVQCKIFSPFNYIPQNRLTFSYMGKFHETVKEIEKNIDKTKLNKKYILLKHKCQKDFKNLNEWNKFNFVPDYCIDHDNSYTILRALKERDAWYLEFLADRLFSILDKNKEITLCRIPSSEKDKISGCDDLIKKLSSKSSLLTDGSMCIQRIKTIPKAHKGGLRNFDQHINSSKINNLNLIENKNVLLIDDIKTSGTSLDAFTHILFKAKPKTLTTFVFGITIGYDSN